EEGDVVSKHDNPGDVNYLLRPNHAYITTTNGFFGTPDVCDIQLNKTYHIAMVYDGVTLKFYRNGFLMSQVAATGTLFQNAWQTRIGFYFSQFYNENFIGYINEVRIWNVARTQAQIQAYMNSALPSPATQLGLLAYYTFDDLLNKQGNPAWNGTLGGSAAINQTNPTCASFVAENDCCPVLSGTISGNSICSGSTPLLTFHSTSRGNVPLTVTYSDGISNYVQHGVRDGIPFALAVPPTVTTVYTLVSIQNAATCPPISISGQTATVSVDAGPLLQITHDTSICAGSSLPLLVSGGNTYAWSPAIYLDNPGAANPVATPVTETKFLVTASDLQLCESRDSVTLSIRPDVIFKAPADTVVCDGDPVTLKGNNDPAYWYSWSPAGSLDNAAAANPVARPTATTQYFLHIEEPLCHAQADFPLTVTVNPLPVITASSSNDIDCLTGIAQLQAGGGAVYNWTPAEALNDPGIDNPVAAIDSTTTFTVNAWDSLGCTGSAFIKVVVTDYGKASLILPNAFTPNNDGVNDCFGIRKWGNVTIKEFSIYNRWGQKVFDTRNPSECWNGTFHGEMQDSGGYVYVIKAVSFCGNITRTGTVMLIR
ncbi:MAG: gliding motility-associated C-terminal domain-containing protein, partial [Chitinophagales bacterium]